MQAACNRCGSHASTLCPRGPATLPAEPIQPTPLRRKPTGHAAPSPSPTSLLSTCRCRRSASTAAASAAAATSRAAAAAASAASNSASASARWRASSVSKYCRWLSSYTKVGKRKASQLKSAALARDPWQPACGATLSGAPKQQAENIFFQVANLGDQQVVVLSCQSIQLAVGGQAGRPGRERGC